MLMSDEWVGSAEIARRLKVKPGSVRTWASRGTDDFPDPRKVARDNLWLWAEVEAWARRTGRLPDEGHESTT
jgi:hypothetical protein